MIQIGTCTHKAGTRAQPNPPWGWSLVFQLRSHTWFQALMKFKFLLSHHRKNAVRDKVTGKKWIYLEIQRNTAWLVFVVLEKTLKSPLDCRKIKPVGPNGHQPRIVIGRTDTEAEAPVLWPLDVKS